MIELGRIVRLQIQTGSLKRGEKPSRVYDPSPLFAVTTLLLTPRGASGATAKGETALDVHHADHSVSKFEAGREVSFGFTSHYRAMRGRYGARMEIGCAGENILIESGRSWRLGDFAAGLAIRSSSSGVLLALESVSVAAPCVEFSRFALADPAASPQDLKPVLQFLDEGTRGFVFTPGGEGEVAVGDALMLLG